MTTVLDKFDINKHYFEDPYPHVIIEDALPEDYYNKLYATWPVSGIKETLPIIGGHTFRYMSNDVLNKKLVPVSTEWQKFFEDHTSQDYYLKVLNIFEKHFLLICILLIELIVVHNFEELHNYVDLHLKYADKFLELYSSFPCYDDKAQI